MKQSRKPRPYDTIEMGHETFMVIAIDDANVWVVGIEGNAYNLPTSAFKMED